MAAGYKIMTDVDGVHVSPFPLVPHYKPGTPMKTARFLLACALVSALAACGSQGITAPETAAPGRPHFDEDPTVVGGGDSTQDTGGAPTHCVPVTIVRSDGSVSIVCQVYANGQLGSGN
jgi:hypothetical protein